MSGSLGRGLIGGLSEIPLVGFSLPLVRIEWDSLQHFLVLSQFSKVSPATLSGHTFPSRGLPRPILLLLDLGGGADVWASIHVPAAVEAHPCGLRHLQEEEMGSGT